MYFTSYLTSAFLLATGVSAFYPFVPDNLPTPGFPSTESERRSFPSTHALSTEKKAPTLDLVKVPGKVRRDNNYSARMGDTPTMKNAMAINDDGSDFSYFAVINIGSKGQEMWMLLDTGAAETWLMGSDCTTDACNRHNTFGTEDSSTLVVTNEKWNVTYGTGTAGGYYVSDSWSFAGFDINMTFASANWASDTFNSFPIDGIFGLGRSLANGKPTVMGILADQKLLQKNIIGVNLQRAEDNTSDGEIVFGDVDSTKYTGDITYTSTLQNSNKWDVPIDDTLIDGNKVNFTGKSAVLDTGTSFIMMSDADQAAVNSMIPGAQAQGSNTYLIPCTSTATLEFVISGISYSIPPKDYVGGPDKTGTMCMSHIVGSSPYGIDGWLLGDVFLKNVYAVFDYDQGSIGLAERKYPPPTSTSSSATDEPTSIPSTSVEPMIPQSSGAITNGDAPAAATGSAAPDNTKTGAASSFGIPSRLSLVPLLGMSYGFLALSM